MARLLGHVAVCRRWAEQEQGPYRRGVEPVRRDIAEDRPGVPLQLGVRLVDDGAPLAGVAVEVWHCDALGRYSGFPPPDPSVVVTAATAPRAEYLPGETFLRGRQVSDVAGMVEFDTMYPGWYPGRTVHVHVIVRAAAVIFTSQLYFPDPVSDEVLATAPYAERPGRDTTNDTDTIFPTGGTPAVLSVEAGRGRYRAGACLSFPAPGEAAGAR
ncbi:MAG: intradiol ring-cleavage dioxygenase [Acidimicrobiales bacterium]